MVDNAGQVKLIDFGIARVFKPGKQSDTQSMGTAGYSAPEQYGTGQTDARSDVYSLGAVLHYLLTRRDPTSAPFNFPPVREINPNVSADTERVIERCLRMRPEERFASAADVKAALFPRSLEPETTFLNRQRPAAGAAINPLRATPVVPPPPVRLPPEKQRSWGPVLALIGLILAIAGVGGYLLYAMSRGPDQVVVPDLLGKNQQAAQQALSTQHLSLGIEGYEASTLPVGVVSHQDPQAQSLAQRGQTVSVWLSSGPRMAAVPELAMDTEARAQKDLASAGLKAGQVTHDYSSSVPKGFVITSSPRAGVQLAPGQSVDYVVSDGPKPAPPPPAPAATLTATTTGPNPAPAPPQQPSFSVKIPVPQDGKSHQVTIRVHQADNTDVTAVDTRASSDVDEVVQAPDAHSISATVDGQPVDLTNRVQPMTQSSPASPSGNTTAGGAAGNSGGAPPGSGNPDAAANGSGASAGDNSSAPGAD